VLIPYGAVFLSCTAALRLAEASDALRFILRKARLASHEIRSD